MNSEEVFVVDDDASVRRAVDRLLRTAGYRVRTFASAQEVITAMSCDRPACLIIDVRMPGCTGLELAEMLRKLPAPPAVIFITGHGDIDMAVRAMKAGAVDFLAKPFSDDALLQAVAQAVGNVQQ
jgi:two-component system, LuxR family, response regulator FixJ